MVYILEEEEFCPNEALPTLIPKIHSNIVKTLRIFFPVLIT
jgi:hypothetical protein